jgi:hypothetical protein
MKRRDLLLHFLRQFRLSFQQPRSRTPMGIFHPFRKLNQLSLDNPQIIIGTKINQIPAQVHLPEGSVCCTLIQLGLKKEIRIGQWSKVMVYLLMYAVTAHFQLLYHLRFKLQPFLPPGSYFFLG